MGVDFGKDLLLRNTYLNGQPKPKALQCLTVYHTLRSQTLIRTVVFSSPKPARMGPLAEFHSGALERHMLEPYRCSLSLHRSDMTPPRPRRLCWLDQAGSQKSISQNSCRLVARMQVGWRPLPIAICFASPGKKDLGLGTGMAGEPRQEPAGWELFSECAFCEATDCVD